MNVRDAEKPWACSQKVSCESSGHQAVWWWPAPLSVPTQSKQLGLFLDALALGCWACPPFCTEQKCQELRGDR